MERSWPWEEQGLEHSRQEEWHTQTEKQQGWGLEGMTGRGRVRSERWEKVQIFFFLIRIRIHWRIMLCYPLEHRSSLEEHSVSWSTLDSFYHTMLQTDNEPQPLSLYWACTQMHACVYVHEHTHIHTHTPAPFMLPQAEDFVPPPVLGEMELTLQTFASQLVISQHLSQL